MIPPLVPRHQHTLLAIEPQRRVPVNRVVIGTQHALLCTARNSRSIGRSMPFRNGLRRAGRAVRAGREAAVLRCLRWVCRALGESAHGIRCLGASAPVARCRAAGTGGNGRALTRCSRFGEHAGPSPCVSSPTYVSSNLTGHSPPMGSRFGRTIAARSLCSMLNAVSYRLIPIGI